MEIIGARCVLRPWRKSDAESLVVHANNENVARQLRDRFPHPYTRSHALGFIAFATSSNGPPSNLAIVVDGRCSVCHPYPGTATSTRGVIRIDAPHVGLGATGELRCVKCNNPTRRTPLPFATAERDDHSLRAAWLGDQCETWALHLPVPVEPHSADVIVVDEYRPELVVAQVRHVEAKKAEGRSADPVFVAPTHNV